MLAYLINPQTRVISVRDFNGDYRSIYPMLGEGVSCFDVVHLGDEGDGMYLDGESLCKPDTLRSLSWFAFDGLPQPYVGNALVLGSSEDGESTAPKVSLADLIARVGFIDKPEVMRMAAAYDRLAYL